jgi:hypothetical protein
VVATDFFVHFAFDSRMDGFGFEHRPAWSSQTIEELFIASIEHRLNRAESANLG